MFDPRSLGPSVREAKAEQERANSREMKQPQGMDAMRAKQRHHAAIDHEQARRDFLDDIGMGEPKVDGRDDGHGGPGIAERMPENGRPPFPSWPSIWY